MQYAQITGVLKNPLLPDPYCKGQAGDKVCGPCGIEGLLASEGQSLEQFLPAVILTHMAKTFTEATLTGMASPQILLLFLTSSFIFLVNCRKPSPLSYQYRARCCVVRTVMSWEETESFGLCYLLVL